MAKISKAKLQEQKFIKEIDEHTKVKNCFLCGRKMTSARYSHVVPRFILREISENGHVSYGHALHKFDIYGLDKTTGISDAYPFKLICKKCDKKTFQNYEDPKKLENFDSLDLNTQKKILCEMAIKARLSHISMKYKELVALDLVNEGRLGALEQAGKIVFAERIEMDEHEQHISTLRKFMKTNKNPFVVLFNKNLDYKTKLATQTIINFNFDLTGQQIFDPFLVTEKNISRFFYLMILPRNNRTRVLFYIEKKYLPVIQTLVNQFQNLSDDDKLHFLFIALIINDQQFYMSPSLADLIFKKDKKLVKLYMKTGTHVSSQSEIQNFRKYTNYLSEEYSK